MERELPSINIEGTDFLIDINKVELREKNNPVNTISIYVMSDVEDGYAFNYSLQEKNIPNLISNGEDTSVKIPELVVLDPAGMAEKYKLTPQELENKTDFDLMVDQTAFNDRTQKGMLPTINIEGHTFYVDIRMDMLRPKDDFLSKGIVFDEIDHYFSEEANAYIIPYNPKTREFQELDYDSILVFPKDLIAVQFPFQRDLDPIGWNRNGGWNIKEDLKRIGLKSHFEAKTIPWKETFLPQIITENLMVLKEKTIKKKLQNKSVSFSKKEQGSKVRKM
ncbi:Uncharacterised protein [Chryseobacterium gleum]|uniref:Uncharacterized protein n=2 Tax=Chryseobacterium gleum TaxID=250 RepID=A0A3S4NT53_CHRGE|nr:MULTISPECIES: hypothetical protein [Bacteroidota]EFK33910.1 hypothetical protein HMPREF0204_12979 [Chryseobacterium gleum ATCC 35910]QQY29812.1 hypothetical protein I6I60_13065 [Chryseobacterium gleum]VEE06127.1 Uncharacterised protein [Chryseobacterium gleum]